MPASARDRSRCAPTPPRRAVAGAGAARRVAQTARPEPRPIVMPGSTSSAAAAAARGRARGVHAAAASQPGGGSAADLPSLYSLTMSKQMETMLLVPVDDSVVFPTMTVTLAIDVGDEERVVLVPRKGDEFAPVGTVADVADRIRLPGGARAVTLEGLHRGPHRRREHRPRRQTCASRSRPHPDDEPVDGKTRELEREYRAVVEEILELRGDDGRVAAFVRSITEPGALADTAGYSPDLTYEQKVELLETLDVTERLAPRARAPARAPHRASGAPPDPRRRPVRRREAAARVLPAQADGVDPEGARRGRRVRRRGVPHEDRRGRHAGRGARAGRARAGPLRAHGRAVGRELDDPLLPRLADRRAVVEAIRRAARPRPRARGAGRRPRRASRTSRTASSSTSRSASCARSAASPRTRRAARSSR